MNLREFTTENTNELKTVTLRVPMDVYNILENLANIDCRKVSREIFFLIKQEAKNRGVIHEMQEQQPCYAKIIQFPEKVAL
jgi:hypothetical protein